MRGLVVGVVLLGLAGCGSPTPRLFTLDATDPGSAGGAAAGTVVELRRVTIPGYADRPEIVRSASAYRVNLAGDERWSEPLGDMVQRVLAEDLQRRLPGAVVYSDAGSLSATPSVVVEADLSRLDADGSGQVVLAGQFELRGVGDTPPQVTDAVGLAVPIAGDGTAAYAAALSVTLGQLADRMVADLPRLH